MSRSVALGADCDVCTDEGDSVVAAEEEVEDGVVRLVRGVQAEAVANVRKIAIALLFLK